VFETNIVVVGNVMTLPEWRQTPNTGQMVAHFRMASTARRFDKDSGQWIDGNQLRLRVTCWRRLAENVSTCLAVGDPIVVTGRLFTQDWTDSENNNRTSYEVEAVAIGHDLARGKSRFYRTKPAGPISEVELAETEAYVRGEATEPVPEDQIPARYGDGVPDEPEPQLPAPADAEPEPEPEPAKRSSRRREVPVPA
jgi:single-strand DNA-binding protein